MNLLAWLLVFQFVLHIHVPVAMWVLAVVSDLSHIPYAQLKRRALKKYLEEK